jgi:hypothetical protein
MVASKTRGPLSPRDSGGTTRNCERLSKAFELGNNFPALLNQAQKFSEMLDRAHVVVCLAFLLLEGPRQ